MIFFKRSELRSSDAIMIINRTDLTHYHVHDKIKGVVSSAQVTYHDPKTKQVHRSTAHETTRATSGDQLKLNVRAESDTHAKAKAKAALEKANENATQLELTVFGNPRLVAGINFTLEGMGRFGGKYHVTKSRHDIDRSSGYRTDIEAKRV